uniref:Translation initiation factor eIF2B subunit alpha n=1 Tax=Rhizochromulina marina TaxID=1034831 RepID=A0A7S2RH27_9STRA|mmetsp:Transcript_16245/g.47694  ORF Transcript_16245/g.47694 Transcript_16245/m.47694 type:complete len:331 (+) Transcript_16245:84-1076(+)
MVEAPPEEQQVVEYFMHILDKTAGAAEEDSLSIVGIKALLHVLEKSTATTVMGLQKELETARGALVAAVSAQQDSQGVLGKHSPLSLESGCELFIRHVSRTYADFPGNFEECKAMLLDRGERFAEMSATSRSSIARIGHPFVKHNSVVLTHGKSRVVTAVLKEAAKAGKQFSVIVTECSPDRVGLLEQARAIADAGIPVTVVSDASVAAEMERVDMALVGAEAVVESGGIVNRTGTFQLGIICATMKKPLYVAVESYKFARLFPLNQHDLPPSVRSNAPAASAWGDLASGVQVCVPRCDYTPAKYISLLFTDLGALTPAAVSDELIKLYQ